jgi:hypothetical protein
VGLDSALLLLLRLAVPVLARVLLTLQPPRRDLQR